MTTGRTHANFGDLLLAVGDPTHVAIVDGPQRYDYAALRSAVATLVAELQTLALPSGSRIGIIGPNSFFWVAAYIAAIKVGVAVPFSDRSTLDDLSAQAGFVDCSAVLMDRRTRRRFGTAFAMPVISDDALTHSGAPLDESDAPTSDTDATLMFTSGTTASPKAVRVTHGNLRANTASIVSYLGLRPSDRVLVILPFHYCFGASLLHTHLAVGGTVVLCNTFTFPQTAVDLIERENCTVFAGVPSSFQLLIRASTFGSRPSPSLRIVQQAGGRLAPQQITELATAQSHSDFYVMYGQTEATSRLSYLPPALLRDKLGSIGRGIPGVTLRVVDDSGAAVMPGATGEIIASGDNISPGYCRDPAATLEKFPGGDLRTGDLATVDEDGYIYIVGRRADFIKSWGHRVSPQQIEEALAGHPGVLDAAVVGLPDPDAGEAIVLVIVPVDAQRPPEPAEVIGHLRDRIPKHMVPKEVRFMDAMPLNANGKVSRADVRALLQADADR